MKFKTLYKIIFLLIFYIGSYSFSQAIINKYSPRQEWFSFGYGYIHRINPGNFWGSNIQTSFNIKPQNKRYYIHGAVQYSRDKDGPYAFGIDGGVGYPIFVNHDKILFYGTSALSLMKAEDRSRKATYVGCKFQMGVNFQIVKEAGLGLELFSNLNFFHHMHGVRVFLTLK